MVDTLTRGGTMARSAQQRLDRLRTSLPRSSPPSSPTSGYISSGSLTRRYTHCASPGLQMPRRPTPTARPLLPTAPARSTARPAPDDSPPSEAELYQPLDQQRPTPTRESSTNFAPSPAQPPRSSSNRSDRPTPRFKGKLIGRANRRRRVEGLRRPIGSALEAVLRRSSRQLWARRRSSELNAPDSVLLGFVWVWPRAALRGMALEAAASEVVSGSLDITVNCELSQQVCAVCAHSSGVDGASGENCRRSRHETVVSVGTSDSSRAKRPDLAAQRHQFPRR